MPDNDDQLQQQYQEILNKYASSLTPPTPEPEVPKIENLMPDPVVEQPPVVTQQPQVVTEPIVIKPPEVIKQPPISAFLPPIVEKPIVSPIYFPPETPADKPSNFFKYLFYVSLLMFFGVASAILYNFFNNQQPLVLDDTSLPTPTVVAAQSCELNDKKYTVNETFPATDTCNSCTCNPDLTISCTQNTCDQSESEQVLGVSTKVKVAVKTYKDSKYKYQFTCPATAKYQIEATSINGNKIPYKQESCTFENYVTTVSVYDNTVIHSFGNVKTVVSEDQKYVVTLEGNDSETISSFKFL